MDSAPTLSVVSPSSTAAGGAVLDMDRVRGALSKTVVQNLEAQLARARDSADAYKESLKAIAEVSGIKKSVLGKWIKARVDEKGIDEREKAEQLQLLFDELAL